MKRHVRLASVYVAAPVQAARPAAAPLALRESSIISLARARVLSDVQVEMAFRFRNDWQAIERERLARPLLERIDAGMPRPDSRTADARRNLERARVLLGKHGFALLTKVCGEGFHIRDLHQSARQRDWAIDNLKLHLSSLVEVWPSALDRGPRRRDQ